MQERLTDQFKDRLESYTSTKDFKDFQTEVSSLRTRVATNETHLKDNEKNVAANSEKIENSKKRIQRLISDLELLKRKTNSALETYSN